MTLFFHSIDDLTRYIGTLRMLKIRCSYCHSNNTLCSHGFVRKKDYGQKIQIVGKRIYCSNRNNKEGCGRTFQIYLADFLPYLHYAACDFERNLKLLFHNVGAGVSSTQLKKCHSRTLFRWIKKIQAAIPLLRDYFLQMNTNIVDRVYRETSVVSSTIHTILEHSVTSLQIKMQAQVF